MQRLGLMKALLLTESVKVSCTMYSGIVFDTQPKGDYQKMSYKQQTVQGVEWTLNVKLCIAVQNEGSKLKIEGEKYKKCRK